MKVSRPPPRTILGQLSDLDLRLLKVFRSVVACGGMAAAELELNIGISTVSRHVKDLETRLGMVLCRRGRGGFALTPEGEQVYQQTLRLLGAVDEFRNNIGNIHHGLGGTMDLAVFDQTATNPASRIGAAIARFNRVAPAVGLQLHVGNINEIERGVIDGKFQVGIIPAHRNSQSLAYQDLFGETMLLYCGRGHPLFDTPHGSLTWERLRAHAFAGLGYHSPNMEASHRARMPRAATGFDQESIATLILSGSFLGFLPDHYAKAFEQEGRMRAIGPRRFHYTCRFVSLTRKSPEPLRTTALFVECLRAAHAG